MKSEINVGDGLWRAIRVPYSVILAVLVGFFMQPISVVAADNKATLKIILTDCWGTPIDESQIQIVPSHSQATMYMQYPQKDSMPISSGDYTVVVRTKYFRTLAKSLHVGKEDVFFPICLELAPIEASPNERSPSLTGRVSKDILSNGPAWARLVGAYCDFSSTALVNSDGSFSFGALRPGRYVLMMFDRGTLKCSGNVDIRAFDTKVTVGDKGVYQEK